MSSVPIPHIDPTIYAINVGTHGTYPGSYAFVSIPTPNNHYESIRYDVFVAALFKKQLPPNEVLDRLHAAVGISGEAGELLDAIKKNWVYGKPLDLENVVEELGDLRFYMQALMNLLGVSEQQVLQHNANKLSKRYVGLKYTDEAAIARADKAPGE